MAKKGGAPTKSEIVATICKDAELSRKQVAAVFESLNGIIKKSLRGPGLFTMPGLLKMKVVKKPATKAREGINPFTGEKMTFKAKPASKKVRVLPLKSLKAMVNN
jgi:DNA-binding protein HU-beta